MVTCLTEGKGGEQRLENKVQEEIQKKQGISTCNMTIFIVHL